VGWEQRTQGGESVSQVVLVDEAVPVLVHDGEGLLGGGGWGHWSALGDRTIQGWWLGTGGGTFWNARR
jgi:hypothetical protein